MKQLLIAIITILITLSLSAQTPEWQWIKTGGANSSLNQNSMNLKTKQIATDGNGNIYGIASVGSAGIAIDTLIAVNGYGYDDFVVFSYSCDGEFRWMKHFGSYNDDMPGGVIVDNQGNVIVSGGVLVSPNGDAHFGDSIIPANSNMYKGYFIAKLDNMGNILFINIPGPSISNAGAAPMRLEADNKGNPVVLTWFSDSTTWNGHHVNSAGHYLVKFDKSDGSLIEIVELGYKFRHNYGTNYRFTEFTIDEDNNTYLWTQVPDSIFISGDTIIPIPNQQNTISVLARFNITGDVVWYKKVSGFGSSSNSQGIIGKPIILNNNIYMKGHTQSYSGSSFMGVPINNPLANYEYNYTGLIASFNKNTGNFKSVINFISENGFYFGPLGIQNNSIIIGSPAVGGTVIINNTDTIKPVYTGSLNMGYSFVASVDTALTHFNWAIATKTILPSTGIAPSCLHIDHNNNIILGGSINGPITNTAGDTTNLVASADNFCIAKIALTNDSCNCAISIPSISEMSSSNNTLTISAIATNQPDSLYIYWGDGDSSIYNPQNTNISHTYTNAGPWNICLRTYGFCGIENVYFNNLYSGIDPNNSSKELTMDIFPNPFNNSINIKLSEYNNGEVYIFDLLGKQVFSERFNGNTKVIDTSELNSGVYFIRISTNDGRMITRKIVK